jgi:sulfatase modifying factor 1
MRREPTVAEFEKYEKQRELGTNQFATVFEALDYASGRTVAIFEFHEKFQHDNDTWRGLWREVLERGKIEHDNILFPLGFHEAERQIVLPFMRGNFGNRLQETPISYDSVRTALKCVLKGLSCLHRNGKVHGNITPSNLLYGADERSQAVRIGFSPGLLVGGVVLRKDRDPRYMAPEMYSEELFGPLGSAVDLYCLGVSAFEMLRGKNFSQLIPGTEINMKAYEQFHMSPDAKFPSLKIVDPKAPNDLVCVIDRLVQKKVQDRYASADDALADLDLQAKDVFEVVPQVKPGPAAGTPQPTPNPPVPKPQTPTTSGGAGSGSSGTNKTTAPVKPTPVKPVTPPKPKGPPNPFLQKHKKTLTVVGGLLGGFVIMSLIQTLTTPAAPEARLKIVTKPGKANLTIGGKKHEGTPVAIRIPPGTYDVEVELPGYALLQDQVTVKLDEKDPEHEQVVNFELTPQISLAVTPETATVKVDGKVQKQAEKGTYQLQMSPGKHTLLVEMDEYQSSTSEVTAPTEKQIAINLERAVAKVDPPPEVKPEVKPVMTTETKPEVKPETKPETKPEVKPEVKPVVKPEPSKGPFQNKIGMTLVRIEPGEFLMGAPDDDDEAIANERPARRVKIDRPFLISDTEVTMAQFEHFAKAMDYVTDVERSGGGGGYDSASKRFMNDEKFSWRETGWKQSEKHPVVNVSWGDAQRFCRWLSTLEGRTYRLPTEEEWEYACRAGTTTRFWTGDQGTDLLKVDNIADHALSAVIPGRKVVEGDDGFPFTSEVRAHGTASANPWGLYNMHGNVREWCQKSADTRSVASELLQTNEPRPVRGGCWYFDAKGARCSAKSNLSSELGVSYVGFRVVQEISTEPPKPEKE